jgi:hypothetical protein
MKMGRENLRTIVNYVDGMKKGGYARIQRSGT